MQIAQPQNWFGISFSLYLRKMKYENKKQKNNLATEVH